MLRTLISQQPKVSLAQSPTPFHLLKRLSSELGCNIWIKRDDLTGNLLSGNKVRKLEYVIAEAIAQGCDTLITGGGLQSNHCRATAVAAAQLGLTAELFLRGPDRDPADGNLLLNSLAGARVHLLNQPSQQRRMQQIMEQRAEQCRKDGRSAFVIPIGASDGYGLWGYLSAALELQQDCIQQGVNPAYIVCASGSGGTQAGLTLGTALAGWQVPVLGFAVCDDSAYFHEKVRRDIEHWYALNPSAPRADVAVHVNDDYIGSGYARAEAEVFETIQMLVQTEGVLLDPVYTAKAFHGMLQELQHGVLKGANDIVFVHTGGCFGVFPYRQYFVPEHPFMIYHDSSSDSVHR